MPFIDKNPIISKSIKQSALEPFCAERKADMTERNNHKHLTMSQRIIIEKGLENKESFAEIARKIRNVASQIFIAQLFALAT